MNKDFTDNYIIHVKDENSNIEYLKFRILEKYSNKLKHCITLRHGGVSTGVYKSLNFRTALNDKYENVEKNLSYITSLLDIDKNNVYKAKQDHTDNILILDNNNKDSYKFSNLSKDRYDGYIVCEKDINTLVTTADCNPIIIYDPILNIFANVHSGWKGTLKRISLKAVKIMNEKFGSNYKDLIVCIGPSIRSCCFTSKEEDFKNKFVDVFKDEKEYIYKDKEERYHFDLIQVITKDFLNIGIKKENIVDCGICTCCNEDSFYSYRKATQRKDEDYATFATIVGLI